MLITSNTRAPILDGIGQPIANGRLEVRQNSDPASRLLQLFRQPDFHVSTPNPIPLNSAGAMPYPVYAKENNAWCHAYNENGELVISYPLNGNSIGDNTDLVPDEIVTKRLIVKGDAIVGDTLTTEAVVLNARNIWQKRGVNGVLSVDEIDIVDILATGAALLRSIEAIQIDASRLNIGIIELRGSLRRQDNKFALEEQQALDGKYLKMKIDGDIDCWDTLTTRKLYVNGNPVSQVSLSKEDNEVPPNSSQEQFKSIINSYPIGSYITCRRNSNHVPLRINYMAYGIGFSSDGRNIEVSLDESEKIAGIFKSCGFTGQDSTYRYYLLRRIE